MFVYLPFACEAPFRCGASRGVQSPSGTICDALSSAGPSHVCLWSPQGPQGKGGMHGLPGIDGPSVSTAPDPSASSPGLWGSWPGPSHLLQLSSSRLGGACSTAVLFLPLNARSYLMHSVWNCVIGGRPTGVFMKCVYDTEQMSLHIVSSRWATSFGYLPGRILSRVRYRVFFSQCVFIDSFE